MDTGNVENVPLPPPTNLVQTIAAAGQYDTFLGALQRTGVDDQLKGEGPFTVFVPNKAAWDKLAGGQVQKLFAPGNEEELKRVVRNHIVPGRLNPSDLAQRNWVVNTNGVTLPIRRSGVNEFVDGAKIVTPNIECANGTINIVDSVIME
jgi:uncharacterized surface protein with fasciclin (FAS1) repeats